MLMINDLHFPFLKKWNIQGHRLRLQMMNRSRTATSVQYEIPLYVDQRLEPILQRGGGGGERQGWGHPVRRWETVLVPPCLSSTPSSHPRIQVLCCARSKRSVCKKKFLRTTLKTQQTQGLSDLPKQLLKRKKIFPMLIMGGYFLPLYGGCYSHLKEAAGWLDDQPLMTHLENFLSSHSDKQLKIYFIKIYQIFWQFGRLLKMSHLNHIYQEW